jgi:hypothetical protein
VEEDDCGGQAVRFFALVLLLAVLGCAPVRDSSRDTAPPPAQDEVEQAARQFRLTLFRELSERAARTSETDPGDWASAAEAWRAEQIEARRVANERLERAILDAAGEQDKWDRERWRSVLLSLSRGWSDE